MKVILINNGDGILVNGDYAHTYSDMAQLANDIKLVQDGDDCNCWDNNDIDNINIAELESDTIGCYVVDLDNINTNWGCNAEELAKELERC